MIPLQASLGFESRATGGASAKRIGFQDTMFTLSQRLVALSLSGLLGCSNQATFADDKAATETSAARTATPKPATAKPESQNTVRVAGIVLKWIRGDRSSNYSNAETLIREAAAHGAQIVCTPECFLDGYSIRDESLNMSAFRELAEPVPGGEYSNRLAELARELDIHLIAALTERDGEQVYNTAVLIGPKGKVLGKYRKHFLWGYEKSKYSPGATFPTFETRHGKIGMMICFDRRHSAAMTELVKNNVDLVFCPAGGGFGDENDRCVAQRSKEGQVPIVFVHPIEFLVTSGEGTVLKSKLFGDRLDFKAGRSKPGVVHYYDLVRATKSTR